MSFNSVTSSNVDSIRAFEYHRWLWRFFGASPPGGDSFWARYYTAYSIIWNLAFTVCFPLTFSVNCVLSTNLIEFCENLFMAMPDTFLVLRFANLWRVRPQLLEMDAILRHLDLRLKTVAECSAILEAERMSKLVFKWMMRTLASTMLLALLFISISPERQLMFSSWYPWNWRDSKWLFVLTVLIQLVGLITQSLLALGNDTYLYAYLAVVAAHLKALGIRISNVGHDKGQNVEQAYEELVSCAKDHELSYKLIKTMATAFSVSCFLQFFCSAIAICALGVFIAFVELSMIKTLTLFGIFLAVTMEPLCVCYAAELVIYEGEQLTNAIYDSNWIDQPTKFRRTLIIMLQRSQRLNIIMALSMVPVRLATIFVMFKNAYSLFTLLRKMNIDE